MTRSADRIFLKFQVGWWERVNKINRYLLSDSFYLNSPTLPVFQAPSSSVVDLLKTGSWCSELNNILFYSAILKLNLNYWTLCILLLVLYLIVKGSEECYCSCRYLDASKYTAEILSYTENCTLQLLPSMLVKFCQHFFVNKIIITIFLDGKIPYFWHSSLHRLCQ